MSPTKVIDVAGGLLHGRPVEWAKVGRVEEFMRGAHRKREAAAIYSGVPTDDQYGFRALDPLGGCPGIWALRSHKNSWWNGRDSSGLPPTTSLLSFLIFFACDHVGG